MTFEPPSHPAGRAPDPADQADLDQAGQAGRRCERVTWNRGTPFGRCRGDDAAWTDAEMTAASRFGPEGVGTDRHERCRCWPTRPSPSHADAVTIRVVEMDDLERTAGIHAAVLPDGFFVALGPRFLRSYHRTFLTSPAGVGILAERAGDTVGFLFGAIDEEAHYHHVARRDRLRLGASGVLALGTRPLVAWQFASTRAHRYARGLRRLARRTVGRQPEAPRRTACGVLSHMAVEPSSRGAGVGSAMLRAFEEIGRANGTSTIRLSTAAGNEPAQRFYEQAGWQPSGERFDLDGHRWVGYARGLG